MIIEGRYYSFHERLWQIISSDIVYLLLFVSPFLIFYFSGNPLIFFILVLFIISVGRAITDVIEYITKIEIGEEFVILTMVSYNKPCKTIQLSRNHTKILLKEIYYVGSIVRKMQIEDKTSKFKLTQVLVGIWNDRRIHELIQAIKK
jgi:hypothetical protein